MFLLHKLNQISIKTSLFILQHSGVNPSKFRSFHVTHWKIHFYQIVEPFIVKITPLCNSLINFFLYNWFYDLNSPYHLKNCFFINSNDEISKCAKAKLNPFIHIRAQFYFCKLYIKLEITYLQKKCFWECSTGNW